MTTMNKELTPPDLKRCQAEMPNGATFMTVGGRPAMVRCTNVPTMLLTEKSPGEDGQIGSMTVCNDCFKVFVKQVGPTLATAVELEKNNG